MDEAAVFDRLADLTNNMYFGLSKFQKAKYQDQFEDNLKDFEKDFDSLIKNHQLFYQGEVITRYLRELKGIRDDLLELRRTIGSKYKICIRGNGKAGKSTLINALLSINDTTGSEIGVLPKTRTIDIFSDEMDFNKAVIKYVDSKGNVNEKILTRDAAILVKKKQEVDFDRAYHECEKQINEKTKDRFNEEVKRDIKKDILEKNLPKSNIREYKWGIGKNDFFHNCLLVDTPGLDQEPDYSEVIEDIKPYAINGVLWVIEQNRMQGGAVKKALEEDVKKLESVYIGNNAFAVINIEDNEEGYCGSETWQKIEKRAKKQLGERFQDVICVNALLAYQGGIEGNYEKTTKSNIEELRRKINSLFVENKSDNYVKREEARINGILDEYFIRIKEYIKELEACHQEYIANRTMIENITNKAQSDWYSTKKSILNQYKSEMVARVKSKAGQIENYRNMSDSEYAAFKNELIAADVFENRINKALEKAIEQNIDKYKAAQENVVISKYENQNYAWNRFTSNYSFAIHKPQTVAVYVSIDNNIGAKIADFIDGYVGKDAKISMFAKRLVNVVTDTWKPPTERMIEEIEKKISAETERMSIEQYLSTYEKVCFDTLNYSCMEYCGKAEEFIDLIELLGRFVDNRPEIHLAEIGLRGVI